MKSTNLLIEQHDDLRAMFRHLKKGNGRTSELLHQLASNLVAHMLVEQELLYPAALKSLEGSELVLLEGYEDHAVARFALDRLVKTDPLDRTFNAKRVTLKDLVCDHFDTEERDVFPKLEKELGDSSKALAVRIKALFERTRKAGYTVVAGKGGPLQASAHAPAHVHAPAHAHAE